MNSLEKYGIVQTSDKNQAYNECGGVSPKVLGTSNGEKVLIKTGTHSNGQDCLSEYFAYKLGTAIGIKVNEVKVIDCGDLLGLGWKLCSVHKWENDFCTASHYGGDLDRDKEDALSFFDELINNDDRHNSNYGVLNDELFCIDNGFAEPWKTGIPSTHLLHRASKPTVKEILEKFMSLTKEDFEEMVKFPEDLQHDLPSYYFSDIVVRMLRCQKIIKSEKEKVKELVVEVTKNLFEGAKEVIGI